MPTLLGETTALLVHTLFIRPATLLLALVFRAQAYCLPYIFGLLVGHTWRLTPRGLSVPAADQRTAQVSALALGTWLGTLWPRAQIKHPEVAWGHFLRGWHLTPQE